MLFFMMMTIASKTASKGKKGGSRFLSSQVTKPPAPGDNFVRVIRVDVVVHGIGITGEEFGAWWEVEVFNLVQNLLAILDVSWHRK
jgi:hypothetical protein